MRALACVACGASLVALESDPARPACPLSSAAAAPAIAQTTPNDPSAIGPVDRHGAASASRCSGVVSNAGRARVHAGSPATREPPPGRPNPCRGRRPARLKWRERHSTANVVATSAQPAGADRSSKRRRASRSSISRRCANRAIAPPPRPRTARSACCPVDAAGAPAGFSMRGFTFGEINVLYNGISTGPQNITSRTMDTSNSRRWNSCKGPSSLMTGLNAIGGVGQLRQPAADQRPDQERTRPVARFARHLPDPLRLGRQHDDRMAWITASTWSVAKSTASSTTSISNLTNFSTQLNYRVNDCVQGVRRRRVQEGLRPCLLGNAAGPDLFRRGARHQRRGVGHRRSAPSTARSSAR